MEAQSKVLPLAFPPGYFFTLPRNARGGGKLDEGVKESEPEVGGGEGTEGRYKLMDKVLVSHLFSANRTQYSYSLLPPPPPPPAPPPPPP